MRPIFRTFGSTRWWVLSLCFAGVTVNSWGSDTDRYTAPLQLMLRQVEVEVPLHSGDSGPGGVLPKVLAAMERVPRHEFVAESQRDLCYESRALPIAPGRRMPAPYVSAILTDLLALEPADRVLEIGTGTGYQAALMSLLAGQVITIEPDPELASAAANRLARLGFDRVEVGRATGLDGWPSRGPFNAILVRHAVTQVPVGLLEQLTPDGVLLVPVATAGGQPVLTRVAVKPQKRRRKPPKYLIQPLMPVEADALPRYR